MKTRALVLGMAISSIGVAAVAQGQPNAPSSPPAEAVAPQSTTQTFDNWTLHCQQVPQTPGGPPATRMCEVVSTVVDGRQRQVLRIAVGVRPQDKGKRAVVLHLPVNVRVNRPIQIVSETSNNTFAFAYQACIPLGCFAESDRQEDIIRWLAANSEARMRVEFSDGQGTSVAVPLVAKGFAAAWKAFQTETAKSQ